MTTDHNNEAQQPDPPFDDGWQDEHDMSSGDNGQNASDEAAVNGWKHPCTLHQAFEPRPTVQFVLEGLFPLPSLSVVYGLPGEFKSMFLMDAAIAVASGQEWLPPAEMGAQAARKTMQVPVFWYDFDNGKRRCDERFEALARARGLSQEPHVPFYYLSIPKPALDAGDPENLAKYLRPLIKQHGIKFMCIDNLATVSGDADENSIEMATVMSNLRTLVERMNIACVIIHHMRKSSGNTADAHPGESLRGHSSINAAVDLALQVRRTGSTVNIQSTKSRGVDVEAFGAEFTFTSRENGELETATFRGKRVTGRGTAGDEGIKTGIVQLLTDRGQLNQSEICEIAQDYEWGAKSKIHRLLEALVNEGRLNMTRGGKNAKLYSLP